MGKKPVPRAPAIGWSRVGWVYFLSDFLAAQKAFNLADTFALAAGLIFFFFAFAAALTGGFAGLFRWILAHRAF